MRKFILCLLSLFIILPLSSAHANCGVEVLEKNVLGSKLFTYFQFTFKGEIVKSSYPKDINKIKERGYPESLEGKDYFIVKYKAPTFANMTERQIEDRILEDGKNHCERLITKEFNSVSPSTQEKIWATKIKDIHDNSLTNLKGKTLSVEEAIIRVDTDSNGEADEEWTVKTDGSKTSVSINP